MDKKLNKRFLIVLALLAAMFAPGCGKPTGPKWLMFAAFDNSRWINNHINDADQKRDHRTGFVKIAERYEGEITMDLEILAKQTGQAWTGTPESFEDLLQVLEKIATTPSNSNEKDTNYAPFFDKVTQACKESKLPVIAIACSDGALDDRKNAKAAAEKLAAEPNFTCLLVAPVIPGTYRDTAKAAMQPLADKGKLVVCSREDMEQHLNEFWKIMEGVAKK